MHGTGGRAGTPRVNGFNGDRATQLLSQSDGWAWTRQLALFRLMRAWYRLEAAAGRWPVPRQLPRLAIHHDAMRIIVLIPKVATGSIVKALEEAGRLGARVEVLASDRREPLPERLVSYDCVAVIRHPYERIRSCYNDKVTFLDSSGARVRRLARHFGLYPAMSFDEFVRWLVLSPHGSDSSADPHWMSQVAMIELVRPIDEVRVVRLSPGQKLEHSALAGVVDLTFAHQHRSLIPGSAVADVGSNEPLLAHRYQSDIARYVMAEPGSPK